MPGNNNNGNVPVIGANDMLPYWGGNGWGGQQQPMQQQGYGFGPFSQPGGGNSPQRPQFFWWDKPEGYEYWNPQATQTQNQAFNIPDYQKNRELLAGLFDKYRGMSLDEISPGRQRQNEFLDVMKEQAMGGGPSAAKEALKIAADKNLKQSMALQATNRGSSSGLNQRLISSQQAQAAQDTAAQGAALRAEEVLNARQNYIGAIENLRELDSQSEQIKQQYMTYFLSQGLNLNQAQAQSTQALESLLAGQYQAAQAIQAQYDFAKQAANAQKKAALIGAAGSIIGAVAGAATGGAGGAFGGGGGGWFGGGGGSGGGLSLSASSLGGGNYARFSDENLKENIRPATKDVGDFLNALTAYKYQYKNKEHGQGDQVSVMAQDLEKSKLGKSLVFETKEGKAVDYGKGFAALLAAQAELNKKINKLEKKA